MAPFESDTEVYETLGQLLSDLVADPATLTRLQQADAVVQYAFRRPDATITLDVRAGREPAVQTGATELQPELVLAMDAEVGRQLLSGDLHPMLALARGELRTKGPVAKLLRLVPAVTPGGESPAGGTPGEEQEADAVVAEPESPEAEGETPGDAPDDAEPATE